MSPSLDGSGPGQGAAEGLPWATARGRVRDMLRRGDHLPLAVRRPIQKIANATLKRSAVSITGRSRYGFTLHGSASDVIARHVAVYGVWEPDISAWATSFLKPGDVVVDVGANLGYFSLLCAQRVGAAGRVLAVEASPTTFEQLEANLRRNAAANVQAVNAIAAPNRGVGRIYAPRAGTLGDATTVPTAGMILDGEVDQVVIDETLTRPARLVKIDTEGDEVNVLRGMSRTLKRMMAGSAVLVEVTPDLLAKRGHSPADVFDALRGFDAHRLPNDYSPLRYSDHATLGPERLEGMPVETTDVLFLKR